MGRIGLALTLAGTAALLPGCFPEPVACPAIGHVAGVSLTVAADYAPEVASLRLKACQDGICTEKDLMLNPGATSVDEGCTPDGVCSATSSPDGTLQGFLELPALSENSLEASVTGISPAGLAIPGRTVMFKPKGEFPYGEQCGRVISASLVLDAAGLRQR
ncbi:hypothetical protein [Paenarthrobacter aurescens]|uniref:Uncharacterized protein n=1 Tax=Paenarthrobacter aurescens TaxID=43663 RepID=A0A4Y3NB03_PAEAU|nr:hypothetical protein [Paenarthrobacter aurescens]MDO6141876.1 hypothetical protein [Paenarthrobacter aurescens]MDO6145681.1 hypothetical protein [Paenarthrobacter aurescens]MDO6156925.1 hypothetical protein [Paenarthrobacter aurescens]MDO6160911.1 hypothetical protein [Paenarthrobacter aurescens]GEB19084.1 hypothetical protein AAU01_18390 [Paenarthrobacter aurescens]